MLKRFENTERLKSVASNKLLFSIIYKKLQTLFEQTCQNTHCQNMFKVKILPLSGQETFLDGHHGIDYIIKSKTYFVEEATDHKVQKRVSFKM